MRIPPFTVVLFFGLTPQGAAAQPAEPPSAKPSAATTEPPPAARPEPFPTTLPAAVRPDVLDLGTALAELETQNLDIAQARARSEQSAAVIRQAQSALYPTLTATGNYTRNSAEAEIRLGDLLPPAAAAGVPESIVIQPLQSWTASAALRVPIVNVSAWYDIEAAKTAEHASRIETEVAASSVKTAFAQAAYAAAALEEVVTASERAVELASEQAMSAERRVRAGTSAPLDVLRAKTEVVRRTSDLERARAELARADLALGTMLGRSKPVRVEVPDLVDAAGPQAMRATAASALPARAELDLYRSRQDAARAQIKSARARLLPQLSATGAVFASDTPYPTGDQMGWRVTVDLTLPLYDGGYRYAKRREAEAQLKTASIALDQQRLRILQEVEDARRDIAVAGEQRRLAATRKQLAEDAAASAKRSFDAGIASSLDVLDANDKLYQADVAVADARARLAQSILALERALGRTR